MLAVGLLWSLGALQAVGASMPFTIGYVLSGLAFVPFTHLILAYPTGGSALRPLDRAAVLALVTLGAALAITLVDPSPIPACDDCPESAFLIADRPGPPGRSPCALSLGAAGA